MNTTTDIALYIHWPFCLSKCPYCDFNSHVSSKWQADQWITAYLAELNYLAKYWHDKKITSIFFGGGTPSLMPASIVAKIIEQVAACAYLSPSVEISLEANPTSVESHKFRAFKDAGVNRVSLGIQSLNAKALHFLGRKHTANEAMKAIEVARSCFANMSFDLIYALPDQDLASWSQQLAAAFDIAGPHLSLYQLTIEEGTKFYQLHQAGKLPNIDADLAADMYLYTNNFLKEKGYTRYEISNYANYGYQCLHNLNYWQYGSYLGVGPGAHSRLHTAKGVRALVTHCRPERWLAEVESNGHGLNQQNYLTVEEILTEVLFMGLRLTEGVTGKYVDMLLAKEEILPKLARLVALQLLQYDHSNIKLTDQGLLLHTSIVKELVA